MSSIVFIEKMSPVRHVFDLCKRIVDAHLSPAVECVRLIIGSFCWVDYLANNGCRTSLSVILSRDRIRMLMLSVHTVVNILLFIRNPHVFNDKFIHWDICVWL